MGRCGLTALGQQGRRHTSNTTSGIPGAHAATALTALADLTIVRSDRRFAGRRSEKQQRSASTDLDGGDEHQVRREGFLARFVTKHATSREGARATTH